MDEFTIRPLVWTEDLNANWTALRSRGEYEISPVPGTDRQIVWYVFAIGTFDTLEEAKAACQADYEKRLLECLAPVVKVDCVDCVFSNADFIYCKNTFGFPASLTQPMSKTTARLGPCDCGRNGTWAGD